MKRLANLKSSSSDSGSNGSSKRRNGTSAFKNKKGIPLKNNPYPTAGKASQSIPSSGNGHLSFYTPPSGRSLSDASRSHSKLSVQASSDGQNPPTLSAKSAAPTVATNTDTVHSEAAQSKAISSATAGGAMSSSGRTGGEGSTFSSPAPSVRSLTTTLTTIQSAAPSALMPTGTQHGSQTSPVITHSYHYHSPSQQGGQFSHQFPSSPPASAIPSHVMGPQTGGGHPATYSTATANNLLTDNASILTLASSSKRRRRNSLDTNASVRALAPSSLFGGSRESLPLSVLSGTVGDQASAAGLHQGRTAVSSGMPNTERASVYSSAGIAPALSSERNSYYAGRQVNTGDGASMRSGLGGHGRNDSITGSIGGIAATGSPLASPREASARELSMYDRVSRRNSGWEEVDEEDIDAERNEEVRK
ncbi:MAG: hypothetical protein LQ347_006181 [Umbilicaria vellea]|nr:MAG: hypothetical protein LQ347_006181 [Umbilicaria vellea]